MYAGESVGSVHEWARACLPAGHLGAGSPGSLGRTTATTDAQPGTSGSVDLGWEPKFSFKEFKISSTGMPKTQCPAVCLCPPPWAWSHTSLPPRARVQGLRYLMGRRPLPPRLWASRQVQPLPAPLMGHLGSYQAWGWTENAPGSRRA